MTKPFLQDPPALPEIEAFHGVDYYYSKVRYGWIPHNASFGFMDLTPSILLLRQFWD
jgi:hypothetical protein